MITVLRLVCLLPFATSTAPAALIAATASFAIWDVLDGVAARRYDSDGVIRRLTDLVVDRTGIGLVLVAATRIDHHWLWFLLVIVLRDLLLSSTLIAVFARRGVLAVGGNLNRLVACLTAAWACLNAVTGYGTSSALLAAVIAVFSCAVGAHMIRQACDARSIGSSGLTAVKFIRPQAGLLSRDDRAPLQTYEPS